jgi:hypothetical protein
MSKVAGLAKPSSFDGSVELAEVKLRMTIKLAKLRLKPPRLAEV